MKTLKIGLIILVIGIFLLIATTPDGTLMDEVELKFEQAGLAQDLYVTSIVAVIV